MEKDRWVDFLAARIRSRISLESVEKAQTWAVALFGFVALGFALGSLNGSHARTFLFSADILYLALFHAVLLLGVYLPGLLQPGQKPLSEALRLRDPASLAWLAAAGFFYLAVLWILSLQAVQSGREFECSNFLRFACGLNVFLVSVYVAAAGIYAAGLFGFPLALVKGMGRLGKLPAAAAWTHAALFGLLGFAYAETSPLGSADFFEHVRVAGLFWIFTGSSLLLIGRLLAGSAVPALERLELDLVTGYLKEKDQEAILSRLAEASVSRRFDGWLRDTAHAVAKKAIEIASYTQDSVTLASREKPSELDLRQVEERYRRAEVLARRLEKEAARFAAVSGLFALNDDEALRAEAVKDQFSRELRNAKLELATVRKHIDEKLVAIKNLDRLGLPKPPAQIEAPPAAKA